MTRIELEATHFSDPVGGLTEDGGRKVGHPPALRALGVQVFLSMVVGRGPLRHLDEVVRRQPAIEVHMAEDPSRGEPLEGAVDRRAMDRRVAVGHLVEQGVG
jgi:hypothetical protein